jgi:hypothetical protein
LALPEPPTNCGKLVTKPAEELVAGLEEAPVAAALVAGAVLELELEPELQAAIPVTTQAASASARHREPVLIHRRVPVKRTIAPSASLR